MYLCVSLCCVTMQADQTNSPWCHSLSCLYSIKRLTCFSLSRIKKFQCFSTNCSPCLLMEFSELRMLLGFYLHTIGQMLSNWIRAQWLPSWVLCRTATQRRGILGLEVRDMSVTLNISMFKGTHSQAADSQMQPRLHTSGHDVLNYRYFRRRTCRLLDWFSSQNFNIYTHLH